MINQDLLEQYKSCIQKAQQFSPLDKSYVDFYKEADLIERRIKTDVVKAVNELVEQTLDSIEQYIRTHKRTDA